MDGWVREDDVRATLGAIEAELSAALTVPERLAASRPLRLRLLRLRLLLAVLQHADVSFPDALTSFWVALQEPLPELAGAEREAAPGGCQGPL
jgi:hypothetical protein